MTRLYVDNVQERSRTCRCISYSSPTALKHHGHGWMVLAWIQIPRDAASHMATRYLTPSVPLQSFSTALEGAVHQASQLSCEFAVVPLVIARVKRFDILYQVDSSTLPHSYSCTCVLRQLHSCGSQHPGLFSPSECPCKCPLPARRLLNLLFHASSACTPYIQHLSMPHFCI